MSSPITSSARRKRRRLALWLGFGVVGLSMGAVWATGFATFSGGVSGAPGVISPIVVPGTPVEPLNPLAATITPSPSAWTVNWAGEWGSTGATEFFKVDLSALPALQTYNISMLLTNGSTLASDADWQSLQLAVELVQTATSCTQANAGTIFPVTGLSEPTAVRDFTFDSYDAAVTWNSSDSDIATGSPAFGGGSGIIGGGGVPGSAVYCIGITTASEPFGNGTFLRDNSALTGLPPVHYPAFLVTVNRVS